MAHWIITNYGNYNIYECSKCGAKWTDSTEWTADISSWTHCNDCGDIIKDIENEYRSDLVYRPMVEENKECKHMMDLGENFVIMSIEKYDAMKDDFNICIEERDKALSILDKELREAKEERDQYLDILKKIAIHKYIGKIFKNSIRVDEFDNPADLTKTVKVTFKVEG